MFPDPNQPNPGLRVLVIEDSPDYLHSSAWLIRMRGHEVRTAPDGHSGLAEAAAFQPKSVVLDIGLPDMSGLDVARALKQLPRPPFIVAVTGLQGEEMKQLSAEAGIDVYLVKPVDPEVLISTLLKARKG